MLNPRAMASDCIKERTADWLMGLMYHIESALTELGIDEELASSAAEKAAEQVREAYSGDTIYIPKGTELKSLLAQHEIWKELKGSNHREVARKFGVTPQWVYQIDKRITKMVKEKLQPDMFSEGK